MCLEKELNLKKKVSLEAPTVENTPKLRKATNFLLVNQYELIRAMALVIFIKVLLHSTTSLNIKIYSDHVFVDFI